MTRGLDHIVHAVRDLDTAADLYRRLGFTVSARNQHPRGWGTQNQIIQLPNVYVELLALADTSGIVPHSPRHFSFGAFNHDFLTRGQGLSMLVLEGRGPLDAGQFRAEAIGDFEPYDFDREGKRPDGTSVRLAFTLAFASDSRAPDIGFFTSFQHNPENFWNPAFQVHANTARGVAGVVLAAQDPGSHARFLAALAGAESRVIANGVTIKTPRGDIEVLTPAAFVRRFGVSAPDVSRGARLAALRISVEDATRLDGVPSAAGISGIYAGNATVIGPGDAMGAVLVFEPSC
jgi:catechol 2,3-dioxygenase-like lactoylglutathione lyase family enzyme